MADVNELNNVPIEDSIDKNNVYQTVTERYYTPRFVRDASGIKGEDHCVLFHTNRICLITLASEHPILKFQKTIYRVNFQVSTNVDRMKNKVSGKGKHGAQFLNPDSPLCFVECADGSSYTICSCIRGKLVEVNEALVGDPNLLAGQPWSKGFVAIVLPNISDGDKQKESLLTLEEYKEKIALEKS